MSVAVAMAMQPDAPIALIRDGSLLDEENMALLHELADGAGGQVWVERVGDADEGAVVIENGTVRENDDDNVSN